MTSGHMLAELRALGNEEDAQFLQRFFKTRPGEYGEGDVFVGVRVPVTRRLAKKFRGAPLEEVFSLLESEIHEARLLALLILVQQYEKGDDEKREAIYARYLKNRDRINNWDLVDTSAEHILGRHLIDGDRAILHELANSGSLWDRRIAIMATFHFIKKGEFTETLALAETLLNDPEDLIHKAVGWMLRETGQRNFDAEDAFLRRNYRKMPRTMLRYAIEKFPDDLRKAYLKGTVGERASGSERE